MTGTADDSNNCASAIIPKCFWYYTVWNNVLTRGTEISWDIKTTRIHQISLRRSVANEEGEEEDWESFWIKSNAVDSLPADLTLLDYYLKCFSTYQCFHDQKPSCVLESHCNTFYEIQHTHSKALKDMHESIKTQSRGLRENSLRRVVLGRAHGAPVGSIPV